MKLKSVEIRNFRAIEEMTLPLHPQLTVLHGPNAQGKTSLLRAIAVGLDLIPMILYSAAEPSFGYRKQDPRRGAIPADVSVSVTPSDGVAWTRHWKQDTVWTLFEHKPLAQWLDGVREAERSGKGSMDLPLVAFFDTERTTLESPEGSFGFPEAEEFDRYRALAGALSARSSFPQFSRWFYALENQELREQKARGDFDHEHPALAAVRRAVCSVLDNVSNLSIRPQEAGFEFAVRTDGQDERLDLNQLSGGYRATLALVGDLAWRMAMGNPHLDSPLTSEAVVLIDEIELHLHPEWQQRILPDLTRTFPNAQFIVTTHSPQVLTTVKPEQVVTLVREDGKIVARAPGWGTYGAEAGDVLTAVMEVEARPKNEFSEKLLRYQRLVSRGEGETQEALQLRSELNAISPRDPELASADMEIRQRRIFAEMVEER